MKNTLLYILLCMSCCLETSAQTRLYIRGTAVPGGSQELTRFTKYPSGNSFKFHGTLNPGTLFITTAEEHTSTAQYYKPKCIDTNIVSTDMDVARTRDTTEAAWVVLFHADNYRFTYTPKTATTGSLTGELFNMWYEAWICGGCVADNQTPGQGNWQLSAGKEMERSLNNMYEFTWVGELKNYTSNDEPKRLKINGQYGWSPKVLHPFRQDENILTASQVWYNGSQDYKWSIVNDGYYRITINVFEETISAEYLGTEDPSGIKKVEEADCSIDVRGLDVTVTADHVMSVSLYGADGKQVCVAAGNDVTVTAPTAGLYILHVTDGRNCTTRKIRL